MDMGSMTGSQPTVSMNTTSDNGTMSAPALTLIPYNGTGPNGGNSLTTDLNVYYKVS